MHRRVGFVIAAGVLLAGAAAVFAARAANPDALWNIVNGRCVPDQQAHGDPKPCVSVDLAGGTAVLKDIVGATQFLLIPTVKIGGIESPEILAPDAPHYFAAAWAARADMEAVLQHKLPRDVVGLTINAMSARSQNQLHIHVDCLSVETVAALRRHGRDVGQTWAPFPVPLAGQSYTARRLDETALASANPFRLVADGVPGAAADMAHQTVAVAGATFPDGTAGFILLARSGLFAHAEELQDHSCAIGHE